MKKDIYIITNDINNKVYIGQAINTAVRWSGHKSVAKCHGGFIKIDKAIAALGVEHFTCSIIEHQVENYNEREQYWISFYNSKFPNGYNVEPGGEGAKVGVESASALIRDDKTLNDIIIDLKSAMSLVEIAEKYKLSSKIISAINRGTAYYNNEISYPIRARCVDCAKNINIESLYYDLINTKQSRASLAKKYNTSIYIIDQINKGEKFYNKDLSYPLRRGILTQEEVLKIQDMIMNTSFSLREIAKQNNTSYATVAHINTGKYHYNKNIKYPIR